MAYTKQNFENGQVLNAENLIKMEDELLRPKSWDELVDKPFGDELVEIMPETEVVAEFDGDQYAFDIDASLFSGNEATLFVTFDGVEYACDVNNDYGTKLYGNPIFIEDLDTGEPFAIFPELGFGLVIDEEPHTIAISAVNVTKIDDKYISNNCRVLYVKSSDPYLYKDRFCTEKITRMDLLVYIQNPPVQILVVLEEIWIPCVLLSPIAARDEFAYGIVHTVDNVYYTAEYTPTTTE